MLKTFSRCSWKTYPIFIFSFISTKSSFTTGLGAYNHTAQRALAYLWKMLWCEKKKRVSGATNSGPFSVCTTFTPLVFCLLFCFSVLFFFFSLVFFFAPCNHSSQFLIYIYIGWISGEKTFLHEKVKDMLRAFIWLSTVIPTVGLCYFPYKSRS